MDEGYPPSDVLLYFNGNKLPTPHPSTTLTPSPKGEGLSLVFAHFVAVKYILIPIKPKFERLFIKQVDKRKAI